MRLKELAAARVRYGYRRLHILLRWEGWEVNHKRTYRIYRDEGLSIRSKLPKRKRAWRYRQGRSGIGGPNEVWAMDFVSDRIFGRPFRILTVVDCHIRERIEAAGARLLYLPAYSPDFNLIELAFAKLRVILRAEAVRTISDLWNTIQRAFRRFPSAECRRYLAAAGFDAYDPT